MTPEQLQALATAIRADTDPDVVAALAIRNDVGLADLYNGASTFIVWKTLLQPDEYREAVVWTEVDALSVGDARIWEWLTGGLTQPINPSLTNVRQGLADCWGAGTTTRTNLATASKRAATKTEALFATGTGTSGTPGFLVFEGQISHWDVSEALNRY